MALDSSVVERSFVKRESRGSSPVSGPYFSVIYLYKLFQQLSQQLISDVKEATNLATEARNIAVTNEIAIMELKRANEQTVNELNELKITHAQTVKQHNMNMSDITNKYNGVMNDYNTLQKRCDNQESYSRRDNLVIHGIPENDDENEQTCMQLVRDFFTNDLQLADAESQSIVFVRCHRLGKQIRGVNSRKRPIIVRFQNFADRKLVWSKRFHLKNKNYTLHENFASDVEYRRRILYPILTHARKSGKYDKAAYLNDDVLKIKGINYTVENLQDLPKDLDPVQFSYKENADWYIFGGIHSKFNYLSNFYNCELKYKDMQFGTLEHAYQYVKAKRYGDDSCSENILCCRTASDAKRIGSRVQNFKRKDWNSVKETVMLELLRIKFVPGTILATQLVSTNGKSLAEAGQSQTFATGLPLSHKDIFDTQKWKKNALGKLLMKVRQELTV